MFYRTVVGSRRVTVKGSSQAAKLRLERRRVGCADGMGVLTNLPAQVKKGKNDCDCTDDLAERAEVGQRHVHRSGIAFRGEPAPVI